MQVSRIVKVQIILRLFIVGCEDNQAILPLLNAEFKGHNQESNKLENCS